MSKPYHKKETLERLYADEELTMKEIAEKYGVSHKTIANWINKHGISRAECATYYTNEGYAMWSSRKKVVKVHQLLAIHNGEDPYKVFSKGEHHVHHKNDVPWDNRPGNVEIVTASEHNTIHHDQRYGDEPWRNKQLLWELYVEEGMSQIEIAEKFDCHRKTINRWMQRFDIPTRRKRKQGYKHPPSPLQKW